MRSEAGTADLSASLEDRACPRETEGNCVRSVIGVPALGATEDEDLGILRVHREGKPKEEEQRCTKNSLA